MLLFNRIQKFFFRKPVTSAEIESVQAYDMWSSTYDDQPGNLMLALDEEIFTKLLCSINLENKTVADIGCGTGRHWQKILDKKPATLTGYDVSDGMLNKLHQKFPQAITCKIVDDFFKELPEASLDVIISSLTVAHIEDLNGSLKAWFRLLKPDGHMIITDFHPAALQKGGKRTFQNDGKLVTVKNFIHPVASIQQFAYRFGLELIQAEEIIISELYKPFYEHKNALHVYEKFNGTPIIYGLHLKKSNDIE